MSVVASGAVVRPFPFASLETLTRAEVASGARMRRLARELVDLEAIEGAVGELTAQSVRIVVRKESALDPARSPDDAVGVVLGTSSDPLRTSRRVLVEFDGALAATLVALSLRQRAPRIVDGGRAVSPEIAGAVAAVLMAALRRAHTAGSGASRVLSAGPAKELARDLRLVERDVTTTTLSVRIGDDAFEARVSVPDAALPAPKATSLTTLGLLEFGDAPLSLPLLVATALASRADLDALTTGDVFVPPRLELSASVTGALTGAISLVAPASERGMAADLAADRRLVVRGRLDNHPWGRESTMPGSTDPHPHANAADTVVADAVLEDVPVVVRVELGTVEMKAREWAELVPGDVIALGRRLGDPAILRVGGIELARGELVQVDGEYGVRILTRTRAGGSGAGR